MKNITEVMNKSNHELPMGNCWVEVSKGAFLKIINDCNISNGDLYCGVRAISELENFTIFKDFVDKDVKRILKLSLEETNNPTVWINVYKSGESFKYNVQIVKIVF